MEKKDKKIENVQEKIINEALKYESIGFSVIPLGSIIKNSDGKKKIQYLNKWKQYQTIRATQDEIKKWSSQNIGIVTGKISGIFVLDVDSYKEGFDVEFLKSLDIPVTPTQETASSGRQYLFKFPDGITIKNDVCIGKKDSGIDIRGEGGMIIAPPSETPYGEYKWLISPFDEPLADIPPKLLEMIKIKGDNELNSRKILPELVNLKEGEGRNNAITSFAGKLLLLMDQEKWDREIWPMVKAVNATYNPPLDNEELLRTYESVKKIETERRLKTSEIKMDIFSWGDFSKIEFPEARWRIKDLIPMEGFVILSAISGEKKTWVSLEMARCISQGINFLNTDLFKTEQGKILYVDQENPERDIVRRGRLLNIKESGNFFLYRPDSLNLNDENTAKEFLNLIINSKIKVVFIDTLRAVAGGLKEDKAEDVRMFFNRFKILKDTGVTIVWLDHRRKPLNFEGKVPKKEQLLGSQDKTASVEILLQLSSEGGSDEIRVYQAKNRLDKEIPSFKIIMKDSIAEDGIKSITLVYDGAIEEDETKKEEAKEKILELLKEEEKTTKEILNMLSSQKIGTKNSRMGLKELVEEGKIDVAKKGKQNLYFIISNNIDKSEDKNDLSNF